MTKRETLHDNEIICCSLLEEVTHVSERFRTRGFIGIEHGREGRTMDATRIREPNHYDLRAEGYSFELHQNVTGQWILTFNGRTWTQEQFAAFTERGPPGRMVTLDDTQSGRTDITSTTTLLVPAVALPGGGASTPCESLCIWSSVVMDSGAGPAEGQLQTSGTQRLTGTASWTSA